LPTSIPTAASYPTRLLNRQAIARQTIRQV
jgi:hypothetical protein